MNLIIDIGNTSIKIAFFNKGKLIDIHYCSEDEVSDILSVKEFNKGIICSVSSTEFVEELMDNFPSLLLLGDKTRIPIVNEYKSTSTLGFDRLANAVGAFELNPNQNSLIIDAGTCLKFDFINNKNQYIGGSISPGLKMRFKALNTFTENLPFIGDVESVDIIGKDTFESISSGVINGMNCEIYEMKKKYQNIYKNLNIYLTGGDIRYFDVIAGKQKNSIFAVNYITLIGLNRILEENAL